MSLIYFLEHWKIYVDFNNGKELQEKIDIFIYYIILIGNGKSAMLLKNVLCPKKSDLNKNNFS